MTTNAPAASRPEPEASAREAGLRYVSDARPGIRRKRSGRGLAYLAPDGRRVEDPATLARIGSLAVPPAWTDVWICPDPRGHLQATGRDARGRKQYRYHPKWREVRDENKYHRLIAFGLSLPTIRERVDRDLARPGLPREKVLAAVVRLLESTLIRVGNEEYARDNRSFGLTTLRDRHAEVNGGSIEFRFRGKGGRPHRVGVHDPRVARVVKRSQELPGQQLLQYVDDDGEVQDIDSDDVNEYLREITGQDFSAKDFRTWAGTVAAAWALQEFEQFDSEAQAKRNIVRAIERVAERLGNTPAVCRKCYVHPGILEAYTDGSMVRALRRRSAAMAEEPNGLDSEESAVLALLRRRLAHENHEAGTTA
ncbi:MAG TPA: DNA topoisomerase IB [Actinomycetota bacterium]